MKKQPILEKNKEAEKKTSDYTVVKRNGTLVPFHRERILYAIDAAFRDTKKVPKGEPFDAVMKEAIGHVTDIVVKQVLHLASKGACLTVEGIQDVVEVALMKNGYHDVARDYIIYRDKHKSEREGATQNLKIFRSDGSLVRFNPIKIAIAIENVFRKTRMIEAQTPDEILEEVGRLTQAIVERAAEMKQTEEKLSVDQIEDMIEEHLVSEKIYDVAKLYILERAEKKKKEPALTPAPAIDEKERKFTVVKKDGSKQKIGEGQLKRKFDFACLGLEKEIDVEELIEASILNFYEGVKEEEIDISNIMAAKCKIEIDPAYSIAASRLLLDVIYRETIGVSASDPRLKESHKKYFKKYLKEAIRHERVNPELLDFDLDELAGAMKLERDDLFYYLGLQNLYDRYFIHHEERRLETPQIFWMRVAMGLALKEGKDKNKRAIEFYDVFSKFYYVSGTPTLFNSGTTHSQLSSCYLSTVMDDLHHIFKVIADDAQLSKWAGGLGNDWTNVRATGALIKGTNGKSQGVIPFLKVANDTAVAVNQCFAPETLLYTGKGIRPISEITKGDLVLGISGQYREVMDTYAYNQKDPMVSINVKHSLEPISVTSGHPFYALKGIPMEQSNSRSLKWLKDGKVKCEWTESKELKPGDYIAKAIPKEIVAVPEFDEEDSRLYGILLGDGHLSKNGSQWGVSGNPMNDTHLEFIRMYLKNRGIHFWETGRGETYIQIHWASGRVAVQDATTGRFVSSGEPTLPFTREDIYDAQGKKHISPRLAHLPRPQALSLIQGLVETDGNVSRGKEITFCNTYKALVEGLRYQLLRLGVPSADNFRIMDQDHTGKRSDGTEITFKGINKSYDLRIPAVPEIAERIGCDPITKRNWFIHNGHIFTRIKEVKETDVKPFVYDLAVEGDESYMTTSGLAHNGGKRKGALCTYLETWHLDVEDFLELRKNTGDERRRTPDMNTANWIPDLFMQRVKENGMWTLFSPNDVPDLHDLYGKAFEKRYSEYEKMADAGEIKVFKKIEAVSLWRKMLSMLFETGHPWITFKDPSNIRSPQDHMGVVHSSNLCTEILLNTTKDEVAVCNLGSINLAKHVTKDGLDEKRLAKTVRTAIRMLDNVIDINFYPIPEAKNANARHRPIGLGLMGFQDALYSQNISYASLDAVQFADESMEMISYYAILASSELAKERGTYESYKGSKWDRGLLPIDTIDLLEKERGGNVDMDRSSKMDWNKVRASVREHGMRNSNTMAIAPTATISNISGVTQSIEPMYKHLFVKSNLSGEFTIINPFLIEKLKELKIWDQEMVDDLKYFDGSIQEIERISDETKQLFLTAFEIEPEWIIECGSRRQKWIDMGQSINLYLSEPSGKKLHQMYFLSWEKGLKTNYYLRSLGATQIEKSTMDINKRGLQPRWMKNKSASSNVKLEREQKDAPVCNLEEGCESCQ